MECKFKKERNSLLFSTVRMSDKFRKDSGEYGKRKGFWIESMERGSLAGRREGRKREIGERDKCNMFPSVSGFGDCCRCYHCGIGKLTGS